MSFKTLMQHIGHDLKVGLDFLLPFAASTGQGVVSLFAPELGPMFRATVAAVTLAEQKAIALKQQKNGPQKLADVLTLLEPVIAQGLADAGKPNDRGAVISYINGIVAILNTAPACVPGVGLSQP
jgi:hypothetical protein